VRCPIELADSVARTVCPYAIRWMCHPSCPLPLPEALRLAAPCDAVLRVLEGWSLPPEFCRPSTDSLLFIIPSPSRVWNRAVEIPKNLRSPAFPRSLGWFVCSAAFATKGLPVFQAIWIAQWACARRASQLVFANCLSWLAPRLISQPDFCLTTSAPDSRRMVPSCQDFVYGSVPEFLVPGEPGLSSSGTVIVNRRSLPGSPGRLRSGLTSVKPALAYALRWITNSAAVNGRALSQSARATYPFGLLLACSLAGTPDSSQSLFPERLQSATGLRRQLRQPGCDSERFSTMLAHNRAVFRSQCWSLQLAESSGRRFGRLPTWNKTFVRLHAARSMNLSAFTGSFP